MPNPSADGSYSTGTSRMVGDAGMPAMSKLAWGTCGKESCGDAWKGWSDSPRSGGMSSELPEVMGVILIRTDIDVQETAGQDWGHDLTVMHSDRTSVGVMEIRRRMFSKRSCGLFAGPKLCGADPQRSVAIRIQLGWKKQALSGTNLYGTEEDTNSQFSTMVPSARDPLARDARTLVECNWSLQAWSDGPDMMLVEGWMPTLLRCPTRQRATLLLAQMALTTVVRVRESSEIRERNRVWAEFFLENVLMLNGCSTEVGMERWGSQTRLTRDADGRETVCCTLSGGTVVLIEMGADRSCGSWPG
ncbi:hypothetical protein GOP47_0013880 [Adiantum capillus-veneris]|uniref:Uncharacterized protein n=1 Tax=Adiantum capillus-veneris TaxID=13818 RepID=A0A9D4UPD0_ADICA|nr:hypothetical protein GOP47_0013880 [Adiantum capillus-veneris]